MGNSVFLVAVLGWHFFPRQTNPVYDLATYVVFFGLFPVLAIRLIVKQSLQSFGFGWGKWKQGLLLMIIGWLMFGSVTLVLFRTTHPDFELFAPASIRTSFPLLLVYLGVMAVIFAGIEILFRGLLLSVWARCIGVWAILFQAMIFLGLSISRGLPATLAEWFVVVSVPLWAGCVFWRSQSLWITFLFSFGTGIILSSLALIFL